MKRKAANWTFGVVLVVFTLLHQDVWFWTDARLVFGFLPVGLAYHAAYSLATALLWWLAIRFMWPVQLEQWADETEEDGEG